MLHGYYRVRTTFVDELFGFTFCMDSNARAVEIARRAGVEVRLIQQTFVLPARRSDRTAGVRRVTWFLRTLAASLEDDDEKPALFDVLTIASRPGSDDLGVAISVAFVTRDPEAAKTIVHRLEALSELAASLGGHVHLVKSVHAKPDTLRAMHRERLKLFFEAKRELDPRGLLQNAFFERVLGPIGVSTDAWARDRRR